MSVESKSSSATSLAKLGGLTSGKTAVLVCDLQEKFRPSILHFDTIVENAGKILSTAKHLEMPVIATEQYPKVIAIRNFCCTYSVQEK